MIKEETIRVEYCDRCGRLVRMMCQKGTGYCSQDCALDRWEPPACKIGRPE